MTTATCVKTNGSFTFLDEYEFKLDQNTGQIEIISDNGYPWYFHSDGDGYYGCIDENGKEVSFLVE